MKVGSRWVKTPVTNSNRKLWCQGCGVFDSGAGGRVVHGGFREGAVCVLEGKVFGELYKNRSSLASADTVTLSGAPVSGTNGTVRETSLQAVTTGTPSITGTARVGSTLTATGGAWSPASKLTYSVVARRASRDAGHLEPGTDGIRQFPRMDSDPSAVSPSPGTLRRESPCSGIFPGVGDRREDRA